MRSSRSKTASQQPIEARAGRSAKRPAARKGASIAHPASVIEQRLGDELRALYQEVLTQPIPARFVELLNKLDGRRE